MTAILPQLTGVFKYTSVDYDSTSDKCPGEIEITIEDSKLVLVDVEEEQEIANLSSYQINSTGKGYFEFGSAFSSFRGNLAILKVPAWIDGVYVEEGKTFVTMSFYKQVSFARHLKCSYNQFEAL